MALIVKRAIAEKIAIYPLIFQPYSAWSYGEMKSLASARCFVSIRIGILKRRKPLPIHTERRSPYTITKETESPKAKF